MERAGENLARIEQFAGGAAVLGCDANTAAQCGQIKNELRTKGRPIPESDIWTAALTMQHGREVVSRYPHFEEVSGLVLRAW